MSRLKTVYIADDDDDDRMLIREALELVIPGVKVVEVEDGINLLNILENDDQVDPYVIVMDMNMPRLNGIETLRELRKGLSFAAAPVVMMSTTLNNEFTLEAYAEGINAFLTKPIKEQDFMYMARAVDLCFLQRSPDPANWINGDLTNAQDVVLIHENARYEQTSRSFLRRMMPYGNITELFNADETSHFFATDPFKTRNNPDLIVFWSDGKSDVQTSHLTDLHRLLASRKLTSSPLVVCTSTIDKIQTSKRRSQPVGAAVAQRMMPTFQRFDEIP